jgi:hypothetical protein
MQGRAAAGVERGPAAPGCTRTEHVHIGAVAGLGASDRAGADL